MKIRSVPPARGTPALKDRVIIYSRRGQLIARAWPKKPKGPPSEKQLKQRQWFKVCREMMKYAAAPQINLTKDATKGTGLYPTDVMMMAAAGTLIPSIDGGGVTYERWIPMLSPVTWQGCTLYRTTGQSHAGTGSTTLSWQAAHLQTVGMWSASDPTKITIPASVNVAQLFAGARVNSQGSNVDWLWIVSSIKGHVGSLVAHASGDGQLISLTMPLAVTAGEVFTAGYWSTNAGTIQADGRTFFGCSILDATP